MDEREKENQVEERSEVIIVEGTERREEIEEGPAIGEAVAEEEEERCEEDPECHSSAKRARVCHFYRQLGSFHCGICKAAPRTV